MTGPDDPLVLYVPGMCGLAWPDRRFVDGLRQAGLDASGLHWTRSRVPIRNLRSRRQHIAAGERVAGWIAANHPTGRPLHLVGHSTGCMVIHDGLTRADHTVTQTIFMASAMDAQTDLEPVLARTEKLINLQSRGDVLVLALGASLAGNATGRHRPGAGLKGFRGRGTDHTRFEARPWDPTWMRQGHWGAHMGYLTRRFARTHVAELIRQAHGSAPA